MKTRVSLKYFVTDSLWKPLTLETADLSQTPLNLIYLAILVTLMPFILF